VIGPSRVELDWAAPDDSTVAGYQVERAVVEVWSEDPIARAIAALPRA
jgi:hypothetical protein